MVKGGRVVTKNASKNVFNGSLHDRKEETKMKSHESPKSSPLPSHNILEEDYNPSLKVRTFPFLEAVLNQRAQISKLGR